MSEPEPKQTKRRQGAWKRWTRTVHIYASLLGLLLLLFFGSTGFVLNHEEWFALARASEQGQATLPAELLSEPVSTPCGHNFCAECLRHAMICAPRCPLCREPIATVVQEREGDWTQKPSADETKAKRKTRSRNWQLRNNKQV